MCSSPVSGQSSCLEPPAFVAHYAVEQRLGAGGQGEVFAAWDTLLLRPVALKRLRCMAGSRDDAHVMEARRSAGLTHPAFVRIHGVLNDASGHWIVMERVFGRELKAVMEMAPLMLPQAVSVTTQAARALAEVHGAGVVHGDIKPSNLMLQDDGLLRILDFGIGRALESLDPLITQPMAATPPVAAGTLAYMAPERLLGAAPTPASDIYGLGAVFLDAVGGRRPATGRSETFNAAALLGGSDAWWFPPDLPWPILQLIRAMGARDPAHRPPDMATVARWLERPDTDPVSVPAPVSPPVSPSAPSAGICRDERRMAIHLGMALMLSLIVGVVAGSHSR